MFKPIVVFLLFLIAQLLAGFVSLIIVSWDSIFQGRGIDFLRGGDVPASVLGLSFWLAYLLLFALLWILRLISEDPITHIAKGKPKHAVRLVFAFFLLAMGFSFLVVPLNLEDAGVETRFQEMATSPIALAWLCVGGPFLEEVFFRDGILRLLKMEGMHSWLAVATSSIAFAVAHGNLAQMFPALCMGILLGMLYLKTRDMRLCVPAHIVNNIVAVIEVRNPRIEQVVMQTPLPILLLIGAVLSLCGGWLFYRMYKF